MNVRTLVIAAASLTLGACAVGPSYHPTTPVPRTARVGAPRGDSMEVFFDSLRTARAADTLPPSAAPRIQPPRPLTTQSLADLAWLDVLRDSTLVRLVNIALRQNRDIEVARARIREYKADAGAAWAPLLPSLTLDGSASRNKVAFGSLSIPPYTAYRATADLAWELDFWGGARRGLQAANADLAAQRAAERAAALSLVANVATGYLQLLELDQEEAISRQTLASRQVTLHLARQRYARGLTSELDVRQFEAQVAVPAARLAQVQQLRADQEHALNVLLGEGPTPVSRGASLADAARAVVVPDSVPASLLYRRPDVEEAERAFAAATARVGVADAARLPAFSITGSWGSQAPKPNNLFSSQDNVYQLLFGVSIPIFAGGRLSNEARAASARADQARARYEQSVLVAAGEAGNALAGLRAARDQLAAQETQTTALRHALALARARYQSGLSDYLEVLDAQRSLFSAQLSESQAELQELTAAVQLYKALGGSWPTPAGSGR